MTESKSYVTASGRVLSEDELGVIAEEVEAKDYDVEELKNRRRGRPLMGSAPAEVVPVRLDPELKRDLEACAKREDLTTSELIRRALRKYLDVA